MDFFIEEDPNLLFIPTDKTLLDENGNILTKEQLKFRKLKLKMIKTIKDYEELMKTISDQDEYQVL